MGAPKLISDKDRDAFEKNRKEFWKAMASYYESMR